MLQPHGGGLRTLQLVGAAANRSYVQRFCEDFNTTGQEEENDLYTFDEVTNPNPWSNSTRAG